MSMRFLLGAVMPLLFLGCAGGQDVGEVSTPLASRGEQHRPLVLLEIRMLRIVTRNESTIVLYEDGLLEERGTPLGRLHKDGRFVDLMGNVRVAMDPRGRIKMVHGEIVIAEDGSASVQLPDMASRRVSVDGTGYVHGVDAETRIEGLLPSLYRTGLYALLLPDILRMQQPLQVQ